MWWLLDSPELPAPTRRAVGDAAAVHVSAASTWEVAIKRAIGKLRLTLPERMTFSAACHAHGFALTEVTHADAEAVAELPPVRRDPFDRLLAATARRRGWALVTRDAHFADLGVAVLWRDGA